MEREIREESHRLDADPATTTQAGLPTAAELNALSYFAIGVASEGSRLGRDVSNRFSFAGSIRGGVMDPVGNSGLSIGTLQTDLGQHPEVARSLVAAYQDWAADRQPEWVLEDRQATRTIGDLARSGNAIEDQGGRQLDAAVMAHLRAFLQSDEGIRYIHDRDVMQAGKLEREIYGPLRETGLFRESTQDDQLRLAAVVAKAYNQSERWGGRILRHVQDGTLGSLDQVKQAIKDLPDSGNEYMLTGRDAALEGAEVLIALRNSDPRSPLHGIWAGVAADPLVDPTRLDGDAARPELPHEYATVKTLFLQRQEAPAFIAALDRGVVSVHGRRDKAGTGFIDDGLYAAGDDFVVWSGDGRGQARVAGEWSEVRRDALAYRRNSDGTIDLQHGVDGRSVRLLHADRHAPALRPVAARDGDVPAQASLEVDESRRVIDRLAPRDRESFDRFAHVARNAGYDEGEAARIAGVALVAMRRDPLMRSADEMRMHGGDLVILHAPHGDLPPMFHLRVDAARAAAEPLEASLALAHALDREQPGMAADVEAQGDVERRPVVART
ncbi:MAG TPA: hypothetical protein VM619_03065 [Luteimonas sp.]|nr:hypothetical protein [Luteimonas sp.]